MIYRVEAGFVISSHGVWRPGCYDTEHTARRAQRLNDEVLGRLQTEANRRAGGQGGVIRLVDLAIVGSAEGGK